MIDDVRFSAPLCKSDRVCIELSYIRGQPVNEENYADIKKELQNIDWARQFQHNGLDESWLYFCSKLSTLTEKY